MSYGILKVEFVFFCMRRQILSLKLHNLLNIKNNGIKVYIFEISTKFCIDWYMVRYLNSMFKIFEI